MGLQRLVSIEFHPPTGDMMYTAGPPRLLQLDGIAHVQQLAARLYQPRCFDSVNSIDQGI